jgi:hypothetical protein
MQPVNGISLRKNQRGKNSLISYLKWIICFPVDCQVNIVKIFYKKTLVQEI